MSASPPSRLLLGLCLFVPLAAASLGATARAENPAHQAAAALYDGIRTATLPNGLRVYLKPIPGSPVVTTLVAYRVGSADEDLSHTGLSHYLEHLMFKGTARLKPGDIDRVTLRNGGSNNAYTSEDYTVYHFDFAADRWEVALEIEADRMRNLRIDAEHEFEQEKGAVIAELDRNEDEPWDLEYKAILPLLFAKGPYGYPVIGERDHVRGATAEVIKNYYDRWYYPNNAALVVVGGFDPDQALAKIEKLFGSLPAGKLPPRKPVPPPPTRTAPVRKEFDSKFDVPRLLMGFNTVRIGDPDFYTLDVIQALLSGGKTSRLYKKLVEDEVIAGAVDTASYCGRYPGWFSVQVQLLKGKDRDRAEDLVVAELKRLAEEPVSEAELKRVKQGLVAGTIFARESGHNLGDSIARGVTTNDLDFLKGYLPRIQAVTAQDVQQTVRKYLDPSRRVSVWSMPRDARAGAPAPQGVSRSPRRAQREAGSGGAAGFSLRDAQRVVLPNGLTLLLLENHRLPIVVAEAVVRDVRLQEPEEQAGIATLVGSLLDEGTAKYTGQQIAELIEDVGGSLSLTSNGGSVKVLTPDRGLGLNLLFDCLIRPSFAPDAFARQKEQLLSRIDDAERQPDLKARMLYRGLVYGKHPYGRPGLGRRAAVEKLTADDCRAFHRRAFTPGNTVVALVGDFQSKDVIEEIKQLTADWKGEPAARPTLPAVEKPQAFVQRLVTLPEAAQLHFFMGHPGIRRANPDYYKLLVMDYVLGTGPGFTDRLSARLRDREGLAYTVSATITSSADEEPGLFTCYIGTEPQNFTRVKQEFLEEVRRLRDEKPSAQEVEDAKKYLLGSLPFQLTTNERIANQLLLIERYGLGFDYHDTFRKAVAAVTPDDVQAVARKYLDPERMVLVAVGAVDGEGRPIQKLGPPKP